MRVKNCLRLAAFAGILLPISVALAADRLSESFGSPEGGLPEGWTAAKLSSESVAEIRNAPGGGNALLIQRTPEGVGSGAIFYTGNGTGAPGATLGDFSAAVTFKMEQATKSTSCTHGVLLRATKVAYKGSQGYYVAVNVGGEDAGLSIYWNPQTHVLNGDRLAFTGISGLVPGVDYILQVKAKGNAIEAQLWSVDAAGAKKELLGEARTEEATHATEGHFALRSGFGNSGPVGTWYKALHLVSGE